MSERPFLANEGRIATRAKRRSPMAARPELRFRPRARAREAQQIQRSMKAWRERDPSAGDKPQVQIPQHGGDPMPGARLFGRLFGEAVIWRLFGDTHRIERSSISWVSPNSQPLFGDTHRMAVIWGGGYLGTPIEWRLFGDTHRIERSSISWVSPNSQPCYLRDERRRRRHHQHGPTGRRHRARVRLRLACRTTLLSRPGSCRWRCALAMWPYGWWRTDCRRLTADTRPTVLP